jgi:hypothetical protein
MCFLSVGQVLPSTGSDGNPYRLYLAGLATPLVLSVHTIVSFDFATSVIPGWHTTIFPPYFVAGAIFSGFAMVQTLMLMTRKILKLEQYITLGAYRKYEQGNSGDGYYCRGSLSDGVVYRLVFRIYL